MFYEITSKRTIVDNKGNDKTISEKFLINGIELFSEAEVKGYELYNNENDIVAIKRSNIYEFANSRRNEEDKIFLITIESMFIDDDGNEKSMAYVVGLFAHNIDEANSVAKNYMSQGMNDMTLIAIKKTKIVDLI
jgi:hypothetical protein